MRLNREGVGLLIALVIAAMVCLIMVIDYLEGDPLDRRPAIEARR